MTANAISANPTPIVNPLTPPERKSYNISLGMYTAMMSFMNQITNLQNYSMTLLQTSLTVQNQEITGSNYFIKEMSGGPVLSKDADPLNAPAGTYSDEQILQWIASYGTKDQKSTNLSVITSQLTVHNTQYNQFNSAMGAITNGLNENSQTTTQNITTALQEYSQGPQSIMQTVAAFL